MLSQWKLKIIDIDVCCIMQFLNFAQNDVIFWKRSVSEKKKKLVLWILFLFSKEKIVEKLLRFCFYFLMKAQWKNSEDTKYNDFRGVTCCQKENGFWHFILYHCVCMKSGLINSFVFSLVKYDKVTCLIFFLLLFLLHWLIKNNVMIK